ncbi:putative Geranylgeranyl reductase family [Candidatus Hydrogenisulfobacillus filiaventi]|uniref:Putative Geranylgeranyl reductase family n=1 Tax=Candidatus Hydrogenisulfobacillus filiaventi TaxID=2707344 RepID=A0A6F8ZJD0_9FIRM|nr:putative Geranylgeranyl reductase family [Candidatus Hydrogenisulfobacillus filiaventi]
MPSEFDLIVVGGGPAGSAAAITAAGAGMRVLLVDRARFPRPKLCSGILTAKTRRLLEALGLDPRPALDGVWDRTWVGFRDHGHLLHHAPLVTALRARLDTLLLEAAARAGAEIRTGTGVRTCDPAGGRVTLEDGRQVQARLLVGADGAAGVTRRALGLPARPGWALEVLVPDPRPPEARTAVVEWGLPARGYAWLWPHAGGRVAVGAGVFGGRAAARRLPALLRAWAAGRGLSLPARLSGHAVPVALVPPAAGGGRLLLAGDAAGLADPLTGEGIAYALWSGILAAQAAIHDRPDTYAGLLARGPWAFQAPLRRMAATPARLLRLAWAARRAWGTVVDRTPPLPGTGPTPAEPLAPPA